MKAKALFLFIVSTILIVPIVYFTLWRPSDSTIQKSLSDVSVLQKSTAHTMPAALESISTPIGITAEMTERFKERVSTYADTLRSLDESAAIQRNPATKAIYSKYESSLRHYEEQLQVISTSVSIYGSILRTCDAMVHTLAEDGTQSFSEASADCDKALDSVSSSPSQSFNEQFLNEYAKKAKTLLSAYKQYASTADDNTTGLATAEAAVNKAKDELNQPLYATIDYKIAAPSNNTFTELTNTLNSQKSSLIR